MQIVIPMSGFGERFRLKGYHTPKPLLVVEGVPIIQHISSLFPGSHQFIFVCNEEHLSNVDFGLESTLNRIGAELDQEIKIVSVKPHKLGPVSAVLEASEYINKQAPTIVNYADFNCLWDFHEFEEWVSTHNWDAALITYRGFHPHSNGETNYAYAKVENERVLAVQEKSPFTENKVEEPTSSGTYYFRTGDLMLKAFRDQVRNAQSVNGEFYVSTAIDMLAKSGSLVGSFQIRHFMQWGTPEDFEEYSSWSQKFLGITGKALADLQLPAAGLAIFLCAGKGERFSKAGYAVHKALLPISGKPILKQVAASWSDNQKVFMLEKKSSVWFEAIPNDMNTQTFELSRPSHGQADSAFQSLQKLGNIPDLVTVLPSDTLLLGNNMTLEQIVSPQEGDFVVVWTRAPGMHERANPTQFSWIRFGREDVKVNVKNDPRHSDANVMAGAFSFSSRALFDRLYLELTTRNILVNGEFYIDSMVEVALEFGIKILEFSPEITFSLGTPYEFETFRYWQEVFDNWPVHPYSLESDPLANTGDAETIRLELTNTDHQPDEWLVG